MGDDQVPFVAVERGYRSVLRCRLAIVWTVLIAVGIVGDYTLLEPAGFGGALPIAALALAIAVVATKAKALFAHLRYRLTDQVLQVLRGWLFHTDTVVPLVRVQHLDVTRGPLDKLFGTASLIVHTAGTHNSIVALPGLAPARAAELRDIIREHVRTDFA